jgi:hypothetical protein
MNSKNNLAFIDGQNLYLGTKQDGWSIDLSKFKIYYKIDIILKKHITLSDICKKKIMNYIKKFREQGLL